MKDGNIITECVSANWVTDVFADFIEGRRTWEEMVM